MKPKKKTKSIPQRKSLSQVFLKESWPCEEIADAFIAEEITSVIEIGPGGGALTKELLKRNIKVFAIEKDERFVDYLTKELAPLHPKGLLTVIQEDILDFNFPKHLVDHPDVTGICGNIPYSISTPIVFHILPNLDKIKKATLLVQLEFAERLASPPRKKSYGSLSVYTQLRSQVCLEFIVPKECFTPIPKVDSSVISFYQKEGMLPEETLKKVEKVTKTAFSQRRKKLSNSLKPFLSTMDSVNLTADLERRCDSLTPEEFVQITKELYQLS